MWEQYLRELIDGFKHPAWGLAHSLRTYKMSLRLAQEQGVEVNKEALLAAAFLHDLGALGSYRQPGVDHAERSVQVIDEILRPTDFPPGKIPPVKDIILGHTFNMRPASPIEAVLFHDADILDFMGFIGVARILSIVGLDDWAPDLPSAITLLRRFVREMPPRLLTPQAQRIGEGRLAEMKTFLDGLAAEAQDTLNCGKTP
jgi:uncharacterized protein